MQYHLIGIHGAGQGPAVFGGLVPHLAAGGLGHFQAVTLPGHGAGDDTPPLADIAAMAQWLQGRIDDVPDQAGRIVLLGHSMGALAALAAAHHPRVAAVIAMGAADRMPVHPDLLQLAQTDPAAAAKLVVKWSCDAGHPQADAVRKVTEGIMEKTSPAALFVDLAACNGWAGLEKTGKPVLVVCGQHDKMTPPAAGAALAEKQGGRQAVVDAGHMMLLEQPQAIAAEIGAFLQGL